mmetsp:Transcript_17404/g.53531  ORF Transcript_17404/g.53531 Transcript_17404/m.53531 type:complete len:261 (+) Transcript_17404:129-911(+)
MSFVASVRASAKKHTATSASRASSASFERRQCASTAQSRYFAGAWLMSTLSCATLRHARACVATATRAPDSRARRLRPLPPTRTRPGRSKRSLRWSATSPQRSARAKPSSRHRSRSSETSVQHTRRSKPTLPRVSVATIRSQSASKLTVSSSNASATRIRKRHYRRRAGTTTSMHLRLWQTQRGDASTTRRRGAQVAAVRCCPILRRTRRSTRTKWLSSRPLWTSSASKRHNSRQPHSHVRRSGAHSLRSTRFCAPSSRA